MILLFYDYYNFCSDVFTDVLNMLVAFDDYIVKLK